MAIRKFFGGTACELCIRDYPESPLEATLIIDEVYLCDVHADEVLNQDLYDRIDREYDYNKEE